MKKQYWVKLFLIILVLFSVSCTSTSVDNQSLEIEQAAVKLSYSYSEKGLYDKALAVLDESGIETYRTSFNRSMIIYLKKDYKNAAEAFLQGFKTYPYHIKFLKMAATCYTESGEKDKAKEVYYQILSLDPGDSESEKLLEKL